MQPDQALEDLRSRERRRLAGGPSLFLWPLAIVLALLGGVFGIFGAFVSELRAGGGVLIIVLGAPIIEEAIKPSGVYLLLWRWPLFIAGRWRIAFLAALGGLAFGLIESLVYVTVYAPDAPSWFLPYRFSVPLALHAATSFMFGLGINRHLLDWAAGRRPLPQTSRNFFLAAISIHALYNLIAVVLGLSGILDFD